MALKPISFSEAEKSSMMAIFAMSLEQLERRAKDARNPPEVQQLFQKAQTDAKALRDRFQKEA